MFSHDIMLHRVVTVPLSGHSKCSSNSNLHFPHFQQLLSPDLVPRALGCEAFAIGH